MAPIVVPPAGVTLEGSRAGHNTPEVFSLKLGNNVIEEMIRCYNSKKPIQLSLGENPILQYGAKSQHLEKSTTSFTQELFRTSNPNTSSDPPSPNSLSDTDEMAPLNRKTNPIKGMFWAGDQSLLRLMPKPKLVPASSRATVRDPAVAALQDSLASESAKKAGNTTRYIKDGAGLPAPGRRGGTAGKTGSSSKLLSHRRALSGDATRSMPPSPGLSGAGSPSLGPTSVPLSQQQLAQAKATRKPVVHLLALAPLTEVALRDKVPAASNGDLKQALQKVGDLNQSTGRWELRRPFYKELDVWAFEYSSDKDRQKVIDNAIRQYDKMRLGVSEPEWDRLLPSAERGTGKCLSKLQAQIAQGSVKPPKANSQKPEGSSRDGSHGDDDSGSSDKNPASSKTESAARPAAHPQPAKAKKVTEKVEKPVSEKVVTTKRWMSAKKPTKKPSPVKKGAGAKQGKFLSSEYIHESDDEDDDEDMLVTPIPAAAAAAIPATKPVAKPVTKPVAKPVAKPVTKPAAKPVAKPAPKPAPKTMKRPREDEEETSDSSIPLSKKVKDDTTHRTFDTSQASRTFLAASTTANKAKDSSPQKSSPLSSPPTNASEFESSSGHVSSSASPAHHNNVNGRRSPIFKRHQKSSSVTSSESSSGSRRSLNPEAIRLATKYRSYYPKYEALYREVANSGGKRNPEREEKLLAMHERLRDIKEQIISGVIYLDN